MAKEITYGGIKIVMKRPVLQDKKPPTVKDPVRYPKIVNGYEDIAKRLFSKTLNATFESMVKKMVKFKNE